MSIIWLVIVLHICWGTLLMIDSRAAYTTAINSMSNLVPLSSEAEGATLIVVSLLCAVSFLVPKLKSSWVRFVLMIPQQFLLFLSGAGAYNAIRKQQFADGVIRPWSFIAADQLAYLLLCLFHFFTLLQYYGVFRLRFGRYGRFNRSAGD